MAHHACTHAQEPEAAVGRTPIACPRLWVTLVCVCKVLGWRWLGRGVWGVGGVGRVRVLALGVHTLTLRARRVLDQSLGFS